MCADNMEQERTTPDEGKEEEPDIPDGRKSVEDQDGTEKETSPDGWKGDEPEAVRRAHTTGGTLHLTSQVVKETTQTGRRSKKIPDLLKSQERKILERDMDRLENEERLQMEKRFENTLEAKKSHYYRQRWAK